MRADATRFSATGYVGGDVDDMVRGLLQRYAGRREADMLRWSQDFFEQQLQQRRQSD